ncbi:lysine-specific demethylase 2B isoform X2 [Patella vulgata]|uniref:lysine-specific demethylase 2B isoform X2 n=1 Tax=Patella vulgata TaxID=6465 RepID=UPI00217F684A|nr:lysine-specific demethylase 2B isoform X2 [Patella vulgata]
MENSRLKDFLFHLQSISPESQRTDSPSTTRGQRRARTKTDSPNPKSRGDRRREPDGGKPRGTETFSLSKAGTSNKSSSQKTDSNRPSETKVPKLRKGDTQGPLAVGDKDKELKVVLEKYVVRPAPLPPPPSHVELANGKKHCLNRLLWMKVFTYLEESELCLCMAICKTWNRWCLDRKLWRTLDLSRKRLKQVHLIGIVKRQPSNLVLVSSVISQKQLVWLVSRLPQLQTLDLTYCSWATICGLCSASCPFLKSLLLKWAVGIRENCFRDLVLPPVDGKPGLNEVSRLIRLRNLDLSGCEITDQSLELIVEYMPRLETLGLSYCMRLTDDGIEKLFLESSPLRSSLSELQLSGCCQLSEKSVVLAFNSCASLTSLRCKNCPKISQEMCQSFVDSFRQRRLVFSPSNMVITATT